MLMTEEQARTKWCPKAIASDQSEQPTAVNRGNNSQPDRDCNCIASKCMAWRWFDADHSERPEAIQGMNDVLRDIQRITGTRRGYCGAFGRPEA